MPGVARETGLGSFVVNSLRDSKKFNLKSDHGARYCCRVMKKLEIRGQRSIFIETNGCKTHPSP